MRTLITVIIAYSILLAGWSGTATGTSPLDSHASPKVEKLDVPAESYDDFAPGLGIFAFLAIVVVLVLLGMGAVLALVFVGIVACLLGFGILTMSTLIGVISRRPRTAVKAFFLQVCGVAGMICGAGTAILMKWLATLQISTSSAIVTGSIVGLLLGVALAVLFNYAWGRLLGEFHNRVGSNRDVTFPHSGAE